MFNGNSKKIEELEMAIKELQDELEFLYGFLTPSTPLLDHDKDDTYKNTIMLSDEAYEIIYKYSENKNFIFMGVA